MKNLLCLFIFLFFTGCITLESVTPGRISYISTSKQKLNIYDNTDEFTNIRTIETFINFPEYISKTSFIPRMIYDNNQNIEVYQLAFFVTSTTWYFIDILYIIINNENIKMKSTYTDRNVMYGGISEWIVFDSSIDMFKKISMAKNVKMKLQGSDGSIILEFELKHFEQMKTFIEYINNV